MAQRFHVNDDHWHAQLNLTCLDGRPVVIYGRYLAMVQECEDGRGGTEIHFLGFDPPLIVREPYRDIVEALRAHAHGPAPTPKDADILGDARQLATLTGRRSDGVCMFCQAGIGVGHAVDCPTRSQPKIVKVLEAAELVTIAYEEERILGGVVRGSQFVAALEALDAALEG